ncbi:hypothetical protein BDR05DRAFT_978581 [Suillus weaverae]|nr:hypothetical protein BDR05DRAFT_978581 [Suillus weaverae]
MPICAGRGNDPGGVKATQQGQLVVLCPACPHPRKNLPDNWDNEPVVMRWLYSFFLAINANFRLKHHLVSTDAKDPGLTCEWAYFMEEHRYKSYLKEHSAVTQEIPQYGLSSLTHFLMLSAINFSYDVACQWHKKLWTCVFSLPEHLHLSHINKIIHFFVPKFHLAAHIPACQTAFSFN